MSPSGTEHTTLQKGTEMFKHLRTIGLAALLLIGFGAVFAQDDATEAEPDVTFRLTTALTPAEGVTFGFVGLDGDLEGVVNPDLVVKVGDVVRVVLVNAPADPMEHDFVIDEFGVHSDVLPSEGDEGLEVSVTFTVTEAGEFQYYCSLPGHVQGGMFGKFIVEE